MNEQCHKRFHACYTRPGISTVRRDTGNSRRCETTSDCGANFYCHDHFHICLKNTPTVTKPPVKTTRTCSADTPCPKGMLCHDIWNICYTPAQVLILPQKNKTQQCQIDSDCRPDEFCHAMATGHVVARQRRNIQKICLPQKFRQFPKSGGDPTCKTDADCGPNKCCLGNLGVCMAYKLPGEMCLIAKVSFDLGQIEYVLPTLRCICCYVVVVVVDIVGVFGMTPPPLSSKPPSKGSEKNNPPGGLNRENTVSLV